MKKLLNRLFERLGYMPKEKFDAILVNHKYIAQPFFDLKYIIGAIQTGDSKVEYIVEYNLYTGYDVMAKFNNNHIIIKRFFQGDDKEYARLCAEELCEKLNERI